ncbi:MAG: hypothetical protein ACJAYC_000688 [Halieaceae bacterium]|jgi:hypothetical protein
MSPISIPSELFQAWEIETLMMKPTNLGSDSDDFLEEGDLLEEVTATAVKRVIAF